MTECWRDWGQVASGLHPMVLHGPQLILLVITYGNVHRILPAKKVHTSFHGQGFYWGQTYKCGLPKQLMLISCTVSFTFIPRGQTDTAWPRVTNKQTNKQQDFIVNCMVNMNYVV